jgi:hypothetical protein
MPTIHTGVRPIFTFADEGLVGYEKIATRKLGDILERLELGENANLQFARETFQPDHVARISFKVMEGILEPIIIIDIDRQKPRLTIEDETREEQEAEEEEIRLYYSPSIWIGTATVLHTKTVIGNNTNCETFGYLPISRILAFEPFGATPGESFSGGVYGYNNTVESHPGLTSICGLPTWSFHHADQPGALIDRELDIFNQTQFVFGQGLIDEGFFGGNFKYESIIRSESGMTAFMVAGAYATTPRDALRSWGQSGAVGAFDDEEDVLAENYWLSSTIVASSYQFGQPSEEVDGVITKTYTVPCIRTTDGVGSDADGIITTTEMPAGTIFNTILPGSYEFNITVEAWECECADCEVRVRLVIGQRVTEIEELSDSRVTYQALVSVFDFVPPIGKGADSMQQAICRDFVLGGHGLCEPPEGKSERGMLDSNGRGIWQTAIYVNPLAGSWELGAPTFRTPFFNETAGGPPCPQSADFPSDPGCQDCSFIPYQEQLGSGYANSGYDCIASGETVANTRTGVAWHFARVVGVDAGNSNAICHVQLVGNDGGEGNCGDLPPYCYGHVFNATGIDPAIPIGADLSGFPTLGGQFGTPGEIGGWAVGQLVVVIGLASSNCAAGSCDRLGSAKLLVSTPTAGGENFRLLYWSQYRCANGVASRNFIEIVEEQSAINTCSPAVPKLTYQDLGNFGGFAPPTPFA